jgi:hypothetical protein
LTDLAQQEAAATPPEHFFDRAAEINVDHVEATLDQP